MGKQELKEFGVVSDGYDGWMIKAQDGEIIGVSLTEEKANRVCALLNAGHAAQSMIGQLAECYRLSGADTDGNEDWRIAPLAVEAVRELRADYDAACKIEGAPGSGACASAAPSQQPPKESGESGSSRATPKEGRQLEL